MNADIKPTDKNKTVNFNLAKFELAFTAFQITESPDYVSSRRRAANFFGNYYEVKPIVKHISVCRIHFKRHGFAEKHFKYR